MMKKAIVTGATSFIGAPLVKKLVDEGYFVYAVIRPNSINASNVVKSQNVKVIECDLADMSRLPYLIKDNCCAFYHIAWNGTRVPERDNPIIQNTNYENCIEAYLSAKELGCRYFISTGSQAEYGKCSGIVGEDYPTNPQTEYGKAKLRSFHTLKELGVKDGIHVGWIRIFSAYGPHDNKNTLIMYSISRMKQNLDVEMTLGTQNWNYIYIDDVVNILYLLSTISTYEAMSFNVCSNDNRMLRDYIAELKKLMNSDSRLIFGAKKYNESEGIISFIPQNDNIKKYLQYNKFTSFEGGVLKCIKSNQND